MRRTFDMRHPLAVGDRVLDRFVITELANASLRPGPGSDVWSPRVVWRGVDEADGSDVAVKQWAAGADAWTFVNERAVLTACISPRIAATLACDDERGLLIKRWIERPGDQNRPWAGRGDQTRDGRRDRATRRPVSTAIAQSILRSAMQGICDAWACGWDVAAHALGGGNSVVDEQTGEAWLLDICVAFPLDPTRASWWSPKAIETARAASSIGVGLTRLALQLYGIALSDRVVLRAGAGRWTNANARALLEPHDPELAEAIAAAPDRAPPTDLLGRLSW